ncbi:MAG: hypothetical protein U0R44_05360 [Candidatus Micrarchaeia archaeon]
MSADRSSKRKVLGLADSLESAYIDPTGYGTVIDAASQICALLKDSEISLTVSEKLKVLRSLNRAKVRAFMTGMTDDYRTFKTLDAISGDLVQIL